MNGKELYSKKKSQFYLIKYLYSYIEIKKDFPKFSEFIICTNKSFNFKSGTTHFLIDDDQLNFKNIDSDIQLISDYGGKRFKIEENKKFIDLIVKKCNHQTVTFDCVKKFLEVLIFAVNQPNEYEIDKTLVIAMSVKHNLNLSAAELLKSFFQVRMSSWLKENVGRFLTQDSFKKFQEKITNKLYYIKMVKLTNDFIDNLKSQNITLENVDFIPSDNNLIVLKMPQNLTVLGSIAVYQKFPEIFRNLDGSYIFMNAESFKHKEKKNIKMFRR